MRRAGKILIGLAAVLAAALGIVGAYPFVLGDMEAVALTDEVRAQMPGKAFAALPGGVTHYEWTGPEDGPVVVLIHGFTSPSFIWDYQAGPLAENGFRVLRYDLYGRGLSDRPKVQYTADRFDRQLFELLDSQGVAKPVDLAGLSMGGAVVIHFIDRHPGRVRRFALFAPSGFPVHVPLKYKALKVPGLGEWIMKALGDKTTLAGLKRQVRNDPEKSALFQRRYKEQMHYKGHKRALLSTLRHNPVTHLEDVYRRVGKKGHKGVLFWGTKDHVIPFEHHELVEAAIPSILFHAIDGGDHIANYETPEKVNEKLVEFLRVDSGE